MQANGTPKTVSATFEITQRDVGTTAVRPGHMAELEQERDALLAVCKLTLKRLQSQNVLIGAPYEALLEFTIKAAEGT